MHVYFTFDDLGNMTIAQAGNVITFNPAQIPEFVGTLQERLPYPHLQDRLCQRVWSLGVAEVARRTKQSEEDVRQALWGPCGDIAIARLLEVSE